MSMRSICSICKEQSFTVCLCAESFRDGTAAKSHVCRDAAAARETDVKAAVARLAKLAAISEMQLVAVFVVYMSCHGVPE